MPLKELTKKQRILTTRPLGSIVVELLASEKSEVLSLF